MVPWTGLAAGRHPRSTLRQPNQRARVQKPGVAKVRAVRLLGHSLGAVRWQRRPWLRPGLGQRPGLVTGTLLGARGGPSAPQGWSAEGNVNSGTSHRHAPRIFPARRLSLQPPPHHSSTGTVHLPAPPPNSPANPALSPEGAQSPFKSACPLKPLIQSLLPRALATPNGCPLPVPEDTRLPPASADTVPPAQEALPASLCLSLSSPSRGRPPHCLLAA